MIKEYEKVESHAILFYSKDHTRDFKIMAGKVKDWRKRIEKLLSETSKPL